MTDFEIIIKALEDQRNTALTQIVQLQLDKAKLEQRIKDLEQELIETRVKQEGLEE